MDDNQEGRLCPAGGIEDVEANIGGAIDLLAAERFGTSETIKQQTGRILYRRERPLLGIAGHACIYCLRERDELSRTDDLGPTARRARAIVESEVDHFGG